MDYNNNGRMTPPPYYSNSDRSFSLSQQMQSVMTRVYVRMFIGLLVSAFCALGVASSPAAIQFIYGNAFVYWGMFIAMFAMVWIIQGNLARMSTTTCMLLFVLFSVLMGCSLGSIFLVYKLGAIARTFFITAGLFGVMSVYGYFTKTDLTRMGTYFMMGLFGLIIVCIVNIFVKSSTLDWIVSGVGVLLFIGLTAWDTQQMKAIAAANLSPQMTDKLATMGALNLYLDFINLFLFLLRFFGGSSND